MKAGPTPSPRILPTATIYELDCSPVLTLLRLQEGFQEMLAGPRVAASE